MYYILSGLTYVLYQEIKDLNSCFSVIPFIWFKRVFAAIFNFYSLLNTRQRGGLSYQHIKVT